MNILTQTTHRERPAYGHAVRVEMRAYLPAKASLVLDVGCNTGTFGHGLKQTRQLEVWGLEPHGPSAAAASGVLDRVVNRRFNDEADLPDAHFDAVFFNDVLEHMIDPWAALQLARRKLKPDGVVIASIPNIRHIDSLEHIFLEADFRYERTGIRDWTHLRFFTRKSAVRMFEECGYLVRTVEGINASWWSPSIWRRLAFRILGNAVEDTKYQQFAIVASPGAAPTEQHTNTGS